MNLLDLFLGNPSRDNGPGSAQASYDALAQIPGALPSPGMGDVKSAEAFHTALPPEADPRLAPKSPPDPRDSLRVDYSAPFDAPIPEYSRVPLPSDDAAGAPTPADKDALVAQLTDPSKPVPAPYNGKIPGVSEPDAADQVTIGPAGSPGGVPNMIVKAAMGAQPPDAPKTVADLSPMEKLAMIQARANKNASLAGFGNLMDSYARAMTPGLEKTESAVGKGDYQQPVKDFEAQQALKEKTDLQDPKSSVSKRAQVIIKTMHPDWPPEQVAEMTAADFADVLKGAQLNEVQKQRGTQKQHDDDIAAHQNRSDTEANRHNLAEEDIQRNKAPKAPQAQDTLTEINKTAQLVANYRRVLSDPNASLQDKRNAHDQLLVQLPNLSKRVVRNAGAWSAISNQVPDPGRPGMDMLSGVAQKIPGMPAFTDPMAKLDDMDRMLQEDAAALGAHSEGGPAETPAPTPAPGATSGPGLNGAPPLPIKSAMMEPSPTQVIRKQQNKGLNKTRLYYADGRVEEVNGLQ